MVDVHILSLKDNEVVQSNLERFPHIEVRQSVNGFNKQEVIQEFGALGIKYIGIQFATYGMLANGITKLKSIKHQIDNDIPYLAFIEDDMLLHDGFMDWLDKATGLFVDESLNLVRLHQWGEGYLTSLSGAKRIWQIFCDIGMVNNIDIQLNFQSGTSLLRYCGHFSRTSGTNEGDCLKTDCLDDDLFGVSGGHSWAGPCAYVRGCLQEEGYYLQHKPLSLQDDIMNGNKFHIAGDDYYHGRNGKEQDEEKAVECWLKGAELGNVQCMKNLSWAYLHGIGVTANALQSGSWKSKAGKAEEKAEKDEDVVRGIKGD